MSWFISFTLSSLAFPLDIWQKPELLPLNFLQSPWILWCPLSWTLVILLVTYVSVYPWFDLWPFSSLYAYCQRPWHHCSDDFYMLWLTKLCSLMWSLFKSTDPSIKVGEDNVLLTSKMHSFHIRDNQWLFDFWLTLKLCILFRFVSDTWSLFWISLLSLPTP